MVDVLAARSGLRWKTEKKFFAEIAVADADDGRVILAKPVTFMNSSGECVGALLRFHKVPLSDLLVVVDDADLPLGQLRLRGGGGPGGHHGLESVTAHVGSPEYARLRVGIGRADGRRDIAGYVLGKVRAADAPQFEAAIERAADQAGCWLAEGLAKAMNQFNGPVDAGQKKDRL